MAKNLKHSETASEYDIPLKDVTDSITQKMSKRASLKRFTDFRHPRRCHSSGAFKNYNAPRTNLSEKYHSLHAIG